MRFICRVFLTGLLCTVRLVQAGGWLSVSGRCSFRYERSVAAKWAGYAHTGYCTVWQTSCGYRSQKSCTMLKNYLKVAWRSLKRNKFYSLISIFGLALGMSCSLLIALWVKDEVSYNRFYKDHQDVYFVRTSGLFNGEVYTNYVTSAPMAPALKKDVPAVAYSVKMAFNRDYLVNVGERSGKESGRYASEDLFDIFPMPALAGNPKAALASPAQIIITRKIAEKYFGSADVVGKTLGLDNKKNYLVGAVIEDIPANSSVQFDWLVNFKETEEDWMKKWGNNSFETFVRLRPNTSQAAAEAAMKDIFKRYVSEKADNYPILQPLKDFYLYGIYKNGKPVSGRIAYVRIFMIVAAFILLIACINFMNMATARSSLRAKEVGMRKVVGAGRISLIRQFMSEALLTTLLALILALVMVVTLLPAFNQVFGKQISLRFTDPFIPLGILGLLAITGILSGSYPALFLSSLQPIHTLKNNLRAGFSTTFLRKALVVFQFTLSVFLIIGIVVVTRQMQYTRTKDLGLDRERLIYMPIEGELFPSMEAFRQEAIHSPAVASATTTTQLPVNIQSTSGDLNWKGKDQTLQTNVSATHVGYDFVKTMNIQLVEGRDFSKDFPSDTAKYLINESAAKLMGMKQAAGQEIEFWNGKAPIVGVMKDFHYESLHTPIKPLILVLYPANSSYMLIKLRAGRIAEGIRDLEKLTKKFNPNYPFEYHFTDDEYDQMYKNDTVTSVLIKYFGMLAIGISGLGLLALAAFTAERRIKEIGIRKVLGASVGNLVALLSKDFLKLVLIAIVIATPLAWYTMHEWLSGFAYQIKMQWWMFALAGVAAIGIALITVSFQSVKAALMNPVRSLRSE